MEDDPLMAGAPGRDAGRLRLPERSDDMGHVNTRQYARSVHEWVIGVGLQPQEYGRHLPWRTNPSIIRKATRNRRAVQILPGQVKIGSAVHYLGMDLEGALEPAERAEV